MVTDAPPPDDQSLVSSLQSKVLKGLAQPLAAGLAVEAAVEFADVLVGEGD